MFESQSKYGKIEDFALQVARGQVPGHRMASYSGLDRALDVNQRTLWEGPSNRIPYPSSATIMTVSSDSVLDTAAGVGARTVTIYGLNDQYIEVNDTITLNGQSPVSTNIPFLRVNRLQVTSAGSTGTAQGTIYIGVGTVTAGVPATTYNLIGLFAGNISQTMAFTIPANVTAYASSMVISFGGLATTFANGFLSLKRTSGIRYTISAVAGENTSIDVLSGSIVVFPPMSDVEISTLANAPGGMAACFCNILYIQND